MARRRPTKTKRRRCDYCREQYRYSDPRSKTCSASCRVRLSNERKKAETNGHRVSYVDGLGHLPPTAKPSTDAAEPMDDETYMDTVLKPRLLPDGPPPPRLRPAPAPNPDPGAPPAYITIRNVPTRFPGTPLDRGNMA